MSVIVSCLSISFIKTSSWIFAAEVHKPFGITVWAFGYYVNIRGYRYKTI